MEEKKAYIFLADGFEEIEALSVVDILRRGGVKVTTISLNTSDMVKGAHDIIVKADATFNHLKEDSDVHMIIFPGGPGVENFHANPSLIKFTKKCYADKILIGAICAAPTFIASLGFLDGCKAVCYPGMEHLMNNVTIGDENVVECRNIITSKCPATAPYFALKLLERLRGKEVSDKVRDQMHFELLS